MHNMAVQPPYMALWHSPAPIPMHHHQVVHRFYMCHAKRGNLMHRVATNANANCEYNAHAKDITISCAHAAAPKCAKLDSHVHHRQYTPTSHLQAVHKMYLSRHAAVPVTLRNSTSAGEPFHYLHSTSTSFDTPAALDALFGHTSAHSLDAGTHGAPLLK